MRGRLALISVATLSALLVVVPCAQAQWLTMNEARYITNLVIEHRYDEKRPFSYDGGISECERRDSDKIRCEAYLHAFTRRGTRQECVWDTSVMIRRGQYIFGTGRTRCYPIG